MKDDEGEHEKKKDGFDKFKRKEGREILVSLYVQELADKGFMHDQASSIHPPP